MEELAERHREEESAVAVAISKLLVEQRDDAYVMVEEQQQTNERLRGLLVERDHAIHLLDTFRQEGSAVIRRMHESLVECNDTAEKYLERIRHLEAKNHALLDELGESHKEVTPQPATSESPSPEKPSGKALSPSTQRLEQYASLLQEADRVIVSMRSDMDMLRQQNAALKQQLRECSAAVGSSHAASQIVALQEELRQERQHRLDSEELSHRILLEQQKSAMLLEQRIVRTPRSAGPRVVTSPSSGVPPLPKEAVPETLVSVSPEPAKESTSSPAAASPSRQEGQKATLETLLPSQGSREPSDSVSRQLNSLERQLNDVTVSLAVS